MAMTNEQDIIDAFRYATDTTSNRLINDSLFIEKAKKAAGKKATKKLLKMQEQIDIQTQAIIQAHDELEARHSEA